MTRQRAAWLIYKCWIFHHVVKTKSQQTARSAKDNRARQAESHESQPDLRRRNEPIIYASKRGQRCAG